MIRFVKMLSVSLGYDDPARRISTTWPNGLAVGIAVVLLGFGSAACTSPTLDCADCADVVNAKFDGLQEQAQKAGGDAVRIMPDAETILEIDEGSPIVGTRVVIPAGALPDTVLAAALVAEPADDTFANPDTATVLLGPVASIYIVDLEKDVRLTKLLASARVTVPLYPPVAAASGWRVSESTDNEEGTALWLDEGEESWQPLDEPESDTEGGTVTGDTEELGLFAAGSGAEGEIGGDEAPAPGSLPELIVVDWDETLYQHHVVAYDVATGEKRILGRLGDLNSWSKQTMVDPTSGYLYAFGIPFGGGNDRKLYAFDLTSGTLSHSVSSTDDVLVGFYKEQTIVSRWSGSQQEVRKMNPATGSSQLMGAFGTLQGWNRGAIIDDEAGYAYALGRPGSDQPWRIYAFDLVEEAFAYSVAIGDGQILVGFDKNKNLIGSRWNGSEQQLWRLDVETGAKTLLGTLGDLWMWSDQAIVDPSANYVFAFGYPINSDSTNYKLYVFDLVKGSMAYTLPSRPYAIAGWAVEGIFDGDRSDEVDDRHLQAERYPELLTAASWVFTTDDWVFTGGIYTHWEERLYFWDNGQGAIHVRHESEKGEPCVENSAEHATSTGALRITDLALGIIVDEVTYTYWDYLDEESGCDEYSDSELDTFLGFGQWSVVGSSLFLGQDIHEKEFRAVMEE